MENDVVRELPREEQLVRLYQLRDKLHVEDLVVLNELEPVDYGTCADCQRDAPRSLYGRVGLCDGCCLSRIRVHRRIMDEQQRGRASWHQ